MPDWVWVTIADLSLVVLWVVLFVYALRLWRVEAKRSAVNASLQLEVALVRAVEALPARPSKYKLRQAAKIAATTAVIAVPASDVPDPVPPLPVAEDPKVRTLKDFSGRIRLVLPKVVRRG